MKVIHLPTTVGGNPQGISKHLRELGVDSETWTITQNYFGYPADKVLANEKDSSFVRELKKIFALRYVFLCDVVFFNFGAGLFNYKKINNFKDKGAAYKALYFFYAYYSKAMAYIELGLLSLLNKLVFIQFQGDDARQGGYCKENFLITFANRVDSEYYTRNSDTEKRRSIAFYARKAKRIYSLNPDLMHVLPPSAEFLPYSHISLEEWVPAYTQTQDRLLRIGHAPSHRAVKGTDLVLEAAERLKQAGYQFEFVLIEGVSNADAKEIYKTIDVLVDQLFSGWYGGLSVEAMALGKPVIAYIRQDDLRFIPKGMQEDLPIIQAEPNTIVEVLEDLLKMSRKDLLDIAHQSRAYVEKWHDPLAIAQRIKSDMEQALADR